MQNWVGLCPGVRGGGSKILDFKVRYLKYSVTLKGTESLVGVFTWPSAEHFSRSVYAGVG